ncbi:MAG TPA: arsenate reductase ArsC [Candidatus Dormibacteraeota bacterium]|nr:arsenate reductase ArsC [Candidatus Dormibacteraeota bacterium]
MRWRPVPEVLFVCVHNAGRSQMAAALLEHRGRGRIRVRSAGSEPASALHPGVLAAMAEIGLDLRERRPTLLTDAAARSADVVVTMGCGDACPIYPGTRHLDWAVPDPAGLPLEAVRPIRDAIDREVQDLLRTIGGPPPGAAPAG